MTPIGLEQRVRRERVRSEAARGLGRAWRVRAPVACVNATTAFTDANRASGEQQCNLQKGTTGSRPQGAGGPGPEATQKENQKQKTR